MLDLRVVELAHQYHAITVQAATTLSVPPEAARWFDCAATDGVSAHTALTRSQEAQAIAKTADCPG
jgi:hypothetical protein